jgi:hypothetical protein
VAWTVQHLRSPVVEAWRPGAGQHRKAGPLTDVPGYDACALTVVTHSTGGHLPLEHASWCVQVLADARQVPTKC